MVNYTFMLTLVGISMFTAGAFGALAYHVSYLSKRLDTCSRDIDSKVEEFKEVTKRASEANNSHAQALIDVQTEMEMLKERQHMLDANIKMGAKASNVWKN